MTASPDDNLTFDQTLAELERAVRDLEDGDLGLEDALGRYERGIGLLKRCYGRLREAEQKVQLLTGMDAEGRPVVQPFDPAPADVAAGDAKRRRTKKTDDGQPSIPF